MKEEEIKFLNRGFKMDSIKVVNRVLRVKGNIIKIRFLVDEKKFETFVPNDQQFSIIKDILLNREYEYVPEL